MRPIDFSKNELVEFIQAQDFDCLKTYTVAKNKQNGELVILQRKPTSKNYRVIAQVKPLDVLVKAFQQATSEKRDWMCYTTLKKEYGEDFAQTISPIIETDNPYYKCAAHMKLYDREVVDFLANKQ